ncbi:MFS transporter [Rhizorhapis sp. SPR117]|uniref:MFS transporter n=1 Tax=Rhizorhapis sp. SPR117 TaxID=2912611 RepID=UPI001EFFDD2A|nr:MFS transporter [Rhizorhapis sp. SPR117]
MKSARALPPQALAALLLAVFVVWFGYSVMLPVLPSFIQAADAGLTTDAVARHTGLASSLYTLALFLFAPLWGWFSDRHSRRSVIIVGLLGYGVSLLGIVSFGGLAGLYLERLTSGLFAAAISPVASAVIGDCAPNENWRARRLAWLGMAATAGLFLGPAVGAAAAVHSGANLAFASTAALAIITAIGSLALLPQCLPSGNLRTTAQDAAGRKVVHVLLALSLVLGVAVGVFEVGLALRGDRTLGLGSAKLALLFAECSLVMFVAQAIVFSPLFKAAATWRTIAPGLAVMGAGVLMLPWSTGLLSLSIAVGLVAASGGILVPVFTYWISLAAGPQQGANLGSQLAVASLGQGIGSAVVGLLFNSGLVPNIPFLLAAALLGFSAAMSLGATARIRGLEPAAL